MVPQSGINCDSKHAIKRTAQMNNFLVCFMVKNRIRNTSFVFVYLVYLSKGSSPQEAQISEALTEIRLLFAGIIHRVWRRRLCKGKRQRCPRGRLLGEHPAQWGASFRWWLWWQRQWKSGRGGTRWTGCRWCGNGQASFFEGKGLLCMGKVDRNRPRPPGYCGFHRHGHDRSFHFPFPSKDKVAQQED